MKRLISNHRLLLFAGVFLAGILVFSAPVHAAWQMIHGNGGHVRDATKLVQSDYYEGRCLRVVQNPGTWNSVQFAVPTQGDTNKGARYIKIKFKTFSDDAWVSQIDVYNGNTKVKVFFGSWTGSKTLTLDMGSIKAFPAGLGIEASFGMGTAAADHWIEFYSAGANFVNKP